MSRLPKSHCPQLACRPLTLIIARNGERSVGLELAGDAGEVLGPLWVSK